MILITFPIALENHWMTFLKDLNNYHKSSGRRDSKIIPKMGAREFS
jgi:hypothetical protein